MRYFSPLLIEFFENTYAAQRLLDGSPKTVKVYRTTLRFFGDYMGKPPRLCDLTDEVVAGFAEHRLKSVGRGTVKRDMDCLLAIWRFVHACGKVKRGPTIRPIHAPTPTPVALTEPQLLQVWQSIQEEPRPVMISCDPYRDVPGPVWWSAIFMLCIETGERLSAVFGLVERDLYLDRQCVEFRAENRKGKHEHKVRPVSEECCEALRSLLALYERRQVNSRVFRWASNHGAIWPRLGEIMRRAGLEDSREWKFHCFRKTAVTQTFIRGGDAQDLAGHASMATTRRHYVDPRQVPANDAIQRMYLPWRRVVG